jgi:8-hydroxy-5-deazaflavin:NADPH oxidoreductase
VPALAPARKGATTDRNGNETGVTLVPGGHEDNGDRQGQEADVVVLAVPGQAVPDVVNEHGAALAGKVVIDAVNRMSAPQPDSRELIAAAAPSARYVRAFSTLGWENFAEPLPGANLFFAADPEARAAAEELISAIGLEPACLGDTTATATVDALLPLWFALVKQNGGNRKIALRSVR